MWWGKGSGFPPQSPSQRQTLATLGLHPPCPELPALQGHGKKAAVTSTVPPPSPAASADGDGGTTPRAEPPVAFSTGCRWGVCVHVFAYPPSLPVHDSSAQKEHLFFVWSQG